MDGAEHTDIQTYMHIYLLTLSPYYLCIDPFIDLSIDAVMSIYVRHTGMYVWMYVCMYVCSCALVHTNKHKSEYIYIYIY